MDNLAPVILFVYNRPQLTLKTLLALKNNIWANCSELFIYADGPKEGISIEDYDNIKKVREIIRKEKWCKNVTIIECEVNKGLASSIINGVTSVINKFDKAIVLEDDILTSPFFLRYMNEALSLYENDQKVLSIGSLNFFAKSRNIAETFFFTHSRLLGMGHMEKQMVPV